MCCCYWKVDTVKLKEIPFACCSFFSCRLHFVKDSDGYGGNKKTDWFDYFSRCLIPADNFIEMFHQSNKVFSTLVRLCYAQNVFIFVCILVDGAECNVIKMYEITDFFKPGKWKILTSLSCPTFLSHQWHANRQFTNT